MYEYSTKKSLKGDNCVEIVEIAPNYDLTINEVWKTRCAFTAKQSSFVCVFEINRATSKYQSDKHNNSGQSNVIFAVIAAVRGRGSIAVFIRRARVTLTIRRLRMIKFRRRGNRNRARSVLSSTQASATDNWQVKDKHLVMVCPRPHCSLVVNSIVTRTLRQVLLVLLLHFLW